MLTCLVAMSWAPCGSSPAADQPNIILIVADDLGWADVGWHGGKYRTPHLDRLAREGVELDQHYVAPMCTPTRAAFLSGRWCSRFGITAAQNERALPFETVTLAGALRSAGYDTALVGKWHLGSKPEWGPQRFGFDRSYGSLAGGVGPRDHRYKTGEYTRTWHRDGELIEEEGHVTDLIAREAVKWIEGRSARPFFLYLAFTAVHIPIDEPQRWLDMYPGIEPLSRRQFAACVSHLDDAVGQVAAALERAGKRDRTLIVFTSDNGAPPDARNDDPSYPPAGYAPGPAGGSNKPLRGQKSQLYEGGIRVPAFVCWPERLKPGKLAAPVHAADWMPTLSALAGYRPPRDLLWDGADIWPLLRGEAAPAPRQLYWAGVGFRQSAVRDGDWKLIVHRGARERAELFHLAADPFEERDLAAQEPERVARLKKLLEDLARRDGDAKPAPEAEPRGSR